ncbi:hypothetical protein [Legionella norrlandica]|uniref:hypothetical protein n=1 Tax=Legionella norrlandica TaxID=1498499 RepID=UPI000690C4C0|nr:hypothetical protein [Legionella norrlandica]
MKETKVSIDSLQESIELNVVDAVDEKTVLGFAIANNYRTFDRPTSIPTSPNKTSWLKCYLPSPNWITNCLPSSESIKKYVPSWSTLGYGSAAILATLPSLPYCFTSTPASISKEWWLSMSLEHQAFLVASSGIFLMVGTATRFKYFHSMMDNLRRIFANFCSSISGFAYNSSILLVSGISATPSAALGYYGSIWAGKIIASSAAFSNFIMTAALRIVFIPNFITSMVNLINKDRRFQKQMLSQLKHLKPDDLEEFNQSLLKQCSEEGINEDVVNAMLEKIYNKAFQIELEHPEKSLFNQPSMMEITTDNLKLLFATAIGGILSGAFFIFISQSGYKGTELICQSISQNCELDNLSYIYKLGISITPGITAAIVAFMSGFEFVEKIIGSIYRHLTQKPSDIIKVVLMIGCCLLTAMSLMNAAKSIASGPNLFDLTANPDTLGQLIYLTLYIWGNYGVAFALDMGACSKLLGLTDHSDPIPTMNNLITWMESNPLSHDTLVGLRQHGFFTKASVNPAKNDIPLPVFNV